MNLGNDVQPFASATQAGVSSVLLVFLHNSIVEMIPYLCAACVLIIVDLFFGVAAAKKRGEVIRLSRVLRRTVNKTIEYICWVMVSATLAMCFSSKAIEYVILGLVMGNEITSIITNYFELHNKRIKGLDIFKILSAKAGIKTEDISIENIKKDGNNKQEF